MWLFGIVLAYSLTVYGEEGCEPGKYGADCNLHCPENCRNLANNPVQCDKDGTCYEGCKVGFYGDLCNEDCSMTCKGHICNQHNAHCSTGCIGNHFGDFCESYPVLTTPGPTAFTLPVEEDCEPGKYGDGCKLNCSDNCWILPNTSLHCNKDNGSCSEGCREGFYGDICNETCSMNCKPQICYQQKGHCRGGCIENHTGDLCEIIQGTTYGSSKVVTTTVAPTNRSSLDSVHAQIIIPVVITVLVVIVGTVCAVCFVRRCRKKGVPEPQEQELLPKVQHRERQTQLTSNSDGKQGEGEDTNLHIACKRGNVEEVEHVLSVGLTDMNSRGLGGWTPLMAAARYGQRDVFDFLVSKGCDGVMVDDSGNNILHLACFGGDLMLVKSILSREIVGINSRGHCGRTPIMAAARKGHKHVLKTLLSRECDASLNDDDGNNILHYACIGGHLAVVQHILNKNIVDINSEGKHGMTPVMNSAEVGHRHVFEFLVHKGADLSRVNDSGNNILHLACIGGHVKILKHILSQNMVNINKKGQDGRTSVLAAASHGRRGVLELLVKKGADLSLLDNHGNNILHCACTGGHLVVVQHILNKNIININSEGKHGMTPVMIAAKVGHKHVFDFLVHKGAYLSHLDDNGNNILHLACLSGSVMIVKYLLSKSIVDINSKGQSRRTPVMMAAHAGQRDVFMLLVSKGADMSLEDEHNDNILHLTCRQGHLDMVKFVLSQSIVDIDCTGRHMRTPVMMAAENGHNEAFNVLVSEGADLSNIDASGNNILHLGCLGGSEGIVQHILSHKVVDINAMNNDGSKAVTIASGRGHSSICELLVSQPTH